MKKKLCSFLLLLLMCLVLLNGCGDVSKIRRINLFDFTADAQITYKSYDILNCKIKSVRDGPLTIDILKPTLLSGISLICVDDGMTVKLGNLSYEADLKRFPQLSFGNDLRKSLISAGQSGEIVKNKDGAYEINVMLDSYRAVLLIDKETYSLVSLEIPDEELKVTFSNFEFTKN